MNVLYFMLTIFPMRKPLFRVSAILFAIIFGNCLAASISYLNNSCLTDMSVGLDLPFVNLCESSELRVRIIGEAHFPIKVAIF